MKTNRYALLYTLVLLMLTTGSVLAHGDEPEPFLAGWMIFVGSMAAGSIMALVHMLLRSNKKWTIAESIIMLGVTTGLVHLALGVQYRDLLFVLNGVAFLDLLAVYYLPIAFFERFRPIAFLGLILLTLATIIAFFVVHGASVDLLGGLTLLDEAALLVALLLCVRASRMHTVEVGA